MNNSINPTLILASASSRRIDLLQQLNIIPSKVIPANIDETPLELEKPRALALRLAQEKAQFIHQNYQDRYVLAADTVVSCGQQILDKAENPDQAREFLNKLSGRRHQVHGGMALIDPNGRLFTRHCLSRVQFSPLSKQEVNAYIESGEWEGKAGGYAIQGFAGAFIKFISGSYSNVVGLSLYDTMKILKCSKFID